jgi:hypothetical protein
MLKHGTREMDHSLNSMAMLFVKLRPESLERRLRSILDLCELLLPGTDLDRSTNDRFSQLKHEVKILIFKIHQIYQNRNSSQDVNSTHNVSRLSFVDYQT